jgi:hypothetical protein
MGDICKWRRDDAHQQKGIHGWLDDEPASAENSWSPAPAEIEIVSPSLIMPRRYLARRTDTGKTMWIAERTATLDYGYSTKAKR